MEEIISIFENTIRENLTHANYKRVCNLASQYSKWVTGEKLDEELTRFTRREDEEMFKQRTDLTVHCLPAEIAPVNSQFKKIASLENIERIIELTDKTKSDELNNVVGNVWGGKSLDEYMKQILVQKISIDPNAFVAIEFDAFDANIEKAKPYPITYNSSQCINYRYKNDVLEFLIVKLTTQRKNSKGELIDTDRYLCYMPMIALDYVKLVYDDEILNNINNNSATFFQANDTDTYITTIHHHKSKIVQAKRLGYILDPLTNFETYVSWLETARPHILDLIESKSNYDISVRLHAFPLKIHYENPCRGEHGMGCNSGMEIGTNEKCKKCNGTGVDIPTNAMESLTIRMPSDPRKDEMIDLNNLIVFKSPDIALLQELKETYKEFGRSIYKSIFFSHSTQATSQNGTNTAFKTATENIMNRDDLNDTLRPFANHYSSIWKYLVGLIAEFTDLNFSDLRLKFEFPKDLAPADLPSLYDELKVAQDGNAPSFVIRKILLEIAEKKYFDEPNELKKYKIRMLFMPFIGKQHDEVMSIITGSQSPKYFEVMYNFADIIFDELEILEPNLYDMPIDVIRKFVDARINEIQVSLSNSQMQTINLA